MKSEDCMYVVWMSCGLLFEGYTRTGHNACKLIPRILQLIANNNQQATASPSAATLICKREIEDMDVLLSLSTRFNLFIY